VARPFGLLYRCYLSACSFCCGFFQSSSCFGFHRRSFCFGLNPCSSGWSPTCFGLIRLVCCDCGLCSSGCFHRCRFQLRPLLSAAEWQRPSAQPPSGRLSIAKRRPFARLCATRSWCSSFPDQIHSSCRRRLPCSPSPKRAVPPRVVRHHGSRSLPRCARLSVSACPCKTTYRPVA
jgi:hypothetical protein